MNYRKRLLFVLGITGLLFGCGKTPSTKRASPVQGSGSKWFILNQEAIKCYRTGKYDHAVASAKKALESAEKNVGPDHPDVASILNNLGLFYKMQRQYVQAEPLYKRALKIEEKNFGPDDTRVTLSLSHLAELYRAQRQYVQAEMIYKRSLAIREKALGPNHPELILELEMLLEFCKIEGKYIEAVQYREHLLSIFEKRLGPNHPILCTSLDNLAVLYRAIHQEKEARKLEQRAAAIRAARR
jgi:tetratricopeptide (TPR) repeat protein